MNLLNDRIKQPIADAAAASVDDGDVDRWLDRHGGNLAVPERRIVRMLGFPTRRQALVARRELAAGTSWKTLGVRGGHDEIDGGRRIIVRGLLERGLQRRIFSAPRGKVVGPVRTKTDYVIFRVSRIKPARVHSRGRSRHIVHPLVVSYAQQDALDDYARELNARWTARTTCAPAFARVDRCGSSR
jgi:hypothetical protein